MTKSLLAIGGVAVVAAAIMVSATIAASDATGGLRVAVTDRADGKPLTAAMVRVTRQGAVVRESITGSDGTVSFAGLPLGDAVIECERVGYIRKPETRPVVIGSEPAITMRLLSSQRDAEYFQLAAASIETEAKGLLPGARKALYEQEWARIQVLAESIRGPMVRELVGAKTYLAFDPEFTRLTKYQD
jgi:hypothetical protein